MLITSLQSSTTADKTSPILMQFVQATQSSTFKVMCYFIHLINNNLQTGFCMKHSTNRFSQVHIAKNCRFVILKNSFFLVIFRPPAKGASVQGRKKNVQYPTPTSRIFFKLCWFNHYFACLHIICISAEITKSFCNVTIVSEKDCQHFRSELCW